jgi:hypothetical protein
MGFGRLTATTRLLLVSLRKGSWNSPGTLVGLIVWTSLNSLPGVCTLQSCSGHGGSGHLWLWLDAQMSLQFDRWGYVLARMPGVEVVSRKYTSWGQEVTAIEFDGRFKEACESVSIFFGALVANCNSPPSP